MAEDISEQQKEKAEHLKRSIEKNLGQTMKMNRYRKKRDAIKAKLEDPKTKASEKLQIQYENFLKDNSLRSQRKNKTKVKASDFKIVKVIGKGAFGEVRIVRSKKTDEVYAMKTMYKKMMISKNQLGHIVAERDLMAEADTPWLVKLHFSFQDATYLYLVMEYCGGGDLMGLLIKKDILPEHETKFYMAELAAAINCVHELGFVHRDLKPDNVLIANNGHVRLSDFGLAKSFQNENDKQLDNWQQYVATLKKGDFEKMAKLAKNGGDKDDQKDSDNGKNKKVRDRKKLYSTVGTPDYIAIEVLYQKGYDKKVDWWSMGVIMFECLVGFAPFHANEPLATCRKIVRYERYFIVPKGIYVSKAALDLMKSLVCPQHRRLDYKKIQDHLWFKKTPWKNLESMKPPHPPKLKSKVDASNFDDVEEEMDINTYSTKVKQSGFSASAKENNRVWGYTFNRKDAQNYKNYLKNTNAMMEEKAKSDKAQKEKEKNAKKKAKSKDDDDE